MPVTALLLVGGCAAEAVTATSYRVPGTEASVRIGVYEPTGDGGDMALLRGTVAVVDGCLVVASADSSAAIVPIFPHDEVAQPTEDTVVLTYRGTDFRIGDTISLAGGGPGTDEYLPAGCSGQSFIVGQAG